MRTFLLAALMFAALFFVTPAYAQISPNNPDKPPPSEEPVQPEPPEPTPAPPQPTPTPASMVTALDPQGVLGALADAGFRGKLGTTSAGRMRITFVASGANTSMYFYDCDADKQNCQALRFFYGLDFKNGVTLNASNDWNRTKLYGRTYVDDDSDPWLDMMVVTGKGMPVELFGKHLDQWESTVGDFRTHFESK